MKDKLKAGQTVWLLNDLGRGKEELVECKITKVGNKYLEVDVRWAGKFHISNLRVVSQYTSNIRLYLTKEEYDEEVLRRVLMNKIKLEFGGFGMPTKYSTSSLQSIVDIIDENAG